MPRAAQTRRRRARRLRRRAASPPPSRRRCNLATATCARSPSSVAASVIGRRGGAAARRAPSGSRGSKNHAASLQSSRCVGMSDSSERAAGLRRFKRGEAERLVERAGCEDRPPRQPDCDLVRRQRAREDAHARAARTGPAGPCSGPAATTSTSTNAAAASSVATFLPSSHKRPAHEHEVARARRRRRCRAATAIARHPGARPPCASAVASANAADGASRTSQLAAPRAEAPYARQNHPAPALSAPRATRSPSRSGTRQPSAPPTAAPPTKAR